MLFLQGDCGLELEENHKAELSNRSTEEQVKSVHVLKFYYFVNVEHQISYDYVTIHDISEVCLINHNYTVTPHDNINT